MAKGGVLDTLKTLKGPIMVEMRTGLRNEAVFGGFAAFVRRVTLEAEAHADPGTRELIARARACIDGYEEADAAVRREKLSAFVRELSSIARAAAAGGGEEGYRPPRFAPKVPLSAVFVPVSALKGVGKAREAALRGLGIGTVWDLMTFEPRRYLDYSKFTRIADVKEGQDVSIIGVVERCESAPARTKRNLWLTGAVVADSSGKARAIWFVQAKGRKVSWARDSIRSKLLPGSTVILSGRPKVLEGRVEFTNPAWEVVAGPVHRDAGGREARSGDPGSGVFYGYGGTAGAPRAHGVIAMYPLTEGLSQTQVRALIHRALSDFMPQDDPIPASIRQRLGIMDLPAALAALHYPAKIQEAEAARRRLAFQEALALQVRMAWDRAKLGKTLPGIAHAPDGPIVSRFMAALPFSLTADQLKVVDEIRRDMESSRPMHRLIQGDVGSGKTVVAAYAMVKAAEGGYQSAMLVPTEILAQQHYRKLKGLFEKAGLPVYLLTGSTPADARQEMLAEIKKGRPLAVIGTHAIIQEGVEFGRLGLAITDEQHRFGVAQRAAIAGKGTSPDVLVMSATPIPRTLALTVWGDLDISTIRQRPEGRKPVKTKVLPGSQREKAYEFIRGEVAKGHQAYIVYPLVEESDAVEARSAEREYERLSKEVFPGLRLGLVHGRMPAREREAVMLAFGRGEIDILVATTVIEVGVDVPNATVIMVEGAERFGLAQIHQLRGRVGRGEHQCYAILVSDSDSPEARRRMEVIERTSDGFEIAEEDLNLRGPGEFMGVRQHGESEMRFIDFARDLDLLEMARAEAIAIVEADDDLSAPEHAALKAYIEHRYSSKL